MHCTNISKGRDSGVGIVTRKRAGRDRILVDASFSGPIRTVPGAHPASYTMNTGILPGVNAAEAWG
jgi:hypothetical protein